MNYSEIQKEIDSATGFDLYRLHSAISRMLDDPSRIIEVKKAVRIGTEIEYFDSTENRAVSAKLLKFQRTRVLVENNQDKKRWLIPYYAINIHKVDTSILESRKNNGLGRNEVSVGDRVGFLDRDNKERYGTVIRLNQKTVTLDSDGTSWRVAYFFLFKVLDPQFAQLPIDRP